MNQSESEQVDGLEEFALILEEQKQQFREVTDEIQRAMLNDDTELTDEMVGELKEIAERSSGLVEKIEAK